MALTGVTHWNLSSSWLVWRAQGSYTHIYGTLVRKLDKWIQLGPSACPLVSGPLHVMPSAGWLNFLHGSSGFQDGIYHSSQRLVPELTQHHFFHSPSQIQGERKYTPRLKGRHVKDFVGAFNCLLPPNLSPCHYSLSIYGPDIPKIPISLCLFSSQ